MASAVEQVVQALNVLYSNPDNNVKLKANTWLSEFQKSNEAWSTAQLILFAPDAPLQTKQFAAQTFKIKITYDLDSLPEGHRIPLRDSLLAAVKMFATGPRVILSQICVALADLALQLTSAEWHDPTSSMIELFGKEPEMANALLEWLGAMAEEYQSNLKLEVKSDFGKREKGTSQAEQVIGLLSMYSQAPGITPALKKQCFSCLSSWLRTGQAPASLLTGSPILDIVFASLADPALFDDAVDCIVDIIHETQELDDNMRVIEEIVPRLITLRPVLSVAETKEDVDTMRGYCRIFVEAGEWYEPMIVRHQASFLPLVEAIAECSAYEDLDVVGITLGFWYRLAKRMRMSDEGREAMEPLLNIFASLVETIIRQLHYPEEEIVGQERDDFKSFRHRIGDTLKDCCGVLGTTACLTRSYEILSAALTSAVNGGSPKWQDLEAPLFSMRTMGAEVDPRDDEIMPRIMDLIPKLPNHPKIRYSAILVIGRYTEWIDHHPDYIQFQLPYVSSGFDDTDSDVSAAAAQAIKYLCKDCSHHLVPYLPQLHTFYQTVTSKLGVADLLDLTAAIAHIIAVMPTAEAPQALSLFCMPNVELVHALAVRSTVASKSELRSACEALGRIDRLLDIVERFPDGLPEACKGTVEQIWSVFDAFLQKYGGDMTVADKTCICLRRGLDFFDQEAFGVAGPLMERLAISFESASSSSYLWLIGKMVERFGRRRDVNFDAALKNVFERMSTRVFTLLQTNSPELLADVLDDYVHLISDLVEYSPQTLFLSPILAPAFQSILSTLTLLSPSILLAALDAIRAIIGHESLTYSPSDPTSTISLDAPIYPLFAAAIHTVVAQFATQLVERLLDELVSFSEDTSSNVLTIFRVLSIGFPNELRSSVPNAVSRIGEKMASESEKGVFLEMFNTAMVEMNPNRVKEAFVWLLRSSKKSRERARLSERI